MKTPRTTRRKFIRMAATAAAAAPVIARPGRLLAGTDEAKKTPEESLKKLIIAVGPWGSGERGVAEGFADRFIRFGHNSGPYLGESKGMVVRLAARFPDDAIGMDEIDLKGLPDGERDLLLGLVGQIYSLTEVRFRLTGEPPKGACQADRTGYTKPPK